MANELVRFQMGKEDILRFNRLFEKICPLLDEEGFDVTGIKATAKEDYAGRLIRYTGEYTINIVPKNFNNVPPPEQAPGTVIDPLGEASC